MTIVRRRKKPIEVDTIQWIGDNESELIDFTNHRFEAVPPEDRAEDPEITAQVFDELHSTWVGVFTGQHVVRGVKGEFYPIAEDVLAETYEPAAAPSVPADADLRSLIRGVIRDCPALYPDDIADRVLAVLPAPADRDWWKTQAHAVQARAEVEHLTADRAAVLREAADDLAAAFGDPMAKHIGAIAAGWLRRRAREVEGEQTGRVLDERVAAAKEQPVAPWGPAPDGCNAETGEPCTNHDREQAHADGEHAFCGPECAEARQADTAGEGQ